MYRFTVVKTVDGHAIEHWHIRAISARMALITVAQEQGRDLGSADIRMLGLHDRIAIWGNVALEIYR